MPAYRLVLLAIDAGEVDPLGGEAVLVDGAVAGSLSSAGFDHSVGQALGFAYVRADCVLDGARITVPVLGVEHSAKVLERALHDPANDRLRS